MVGTSPTQSARVVDDATKDDLRRWCLVAVEGLAAGIEAAPDAPVPTYPHWTVRDLALHVVRVFGNAAIALESGVLQRPRPELGVVRGDDAATLADAVRQALREADSALERCQHDVVWTPVGARGSSFWRRRLLREAVLHRWDAEQASGAARAPDQEQALELIDEFLDTDIARAFADPDRERSGVVAIRSGMRRWTVDLARRSVDVNAGDGRAIATISGESAAVWLWLMRREGLPGPVSIDDVDGSAGAFTDLIDRFNRPSR